MLGILSNSKESVSARVLRRESSEMMRTSDAQRLGKERQTKEMGSRRGKVSSRLADRGASSVDSRSRVRPLASLTPFSCQGTPLHPRTLASARRSHHHGTDR